MHEGLTVMANSNATPLHMIDLILKKRDGVPLNEREIGFVAAGAAAGTIPLEQLSAWLMAAWLRGLSLGEIRALTLAMRDSGEKFSPARLGKQAVDKQDEFSGCAAGSGVRRCRADDQRAGAGTHRRNAGQAGVHSGIPDGDDAGRI
jgi:hypothetical protein